MKNKTLITLFILGGLLVLAGAFMKVLHYDYGNYFIGAGLLFEVIAIGFVLGKVIKN
jgi:hypothetical protein